MTRPFFYLVSAFLFLQCSNVTDKAEFSNPDTINELLLLLNKIDDTESNFLLWTGAMQCTDDLIRPILPFGEYSFSDSIGFHFIWFKEDFLTLPSPDNNWERKIHNYSFQEFTLTSTEFSLYAFSKRMVPSIDPELDFEGYLTQMKVDRMIFPDTVHVFKKKKNNWAFIKALSVDNCEEYDELRINIITER